VLGEKSRPPAPVGVNGKRSYDELAEKKEVGSAKKKQKKDEQPKQAQKQLIFEEWKPNI